MKRPRRAVALQLFLLFVSPVGLYGEGSEATALDRFVAKPDPSFGFHLVDSTPGFGYTTHVLELTSQTWLTSAEVDHPIWEHQLTIFVPSQLSTTTAVLVVDSGSNDEPFPEINSTLGTASVLIGAVVADLRIVPNQPLQFRDEARERSEDAIIAYSWDKYLRGHGEDWPAQLPMTKAAVRAMDAVTEFSKSSDGGANNIDRFVVTGGSKRGWAAWLTAAVDERVVAIAPAVSDLLNLGPSLADHWQAYGFWAPALKDYEEKGIMAWFWSEPMRNLLQMIDPYEYRERLTMPKYVINAAGDQFFLPTSSQFYFDDLPGPKYLRYVPNVSHGLDEPGNDALGGLLAWGNAIIKGMSLPQFSWSLPEEGGIVLSTSDPPAMVKLWEATNPSARDFRLETIGASWTSTTVTSSGNGIYEASVEAPERGWTAYFLEMTYPSGSLFPLKFSTPVRVTPDTLPYGPPVVSVLSASYRPLLARNAIASAFGLNLATRSEAATSLPLPTELADVRVKLTDEQGIPRNADLFYVSPNQVNFLVSAGVSPGLGRVEIYRHDVKVGEGQALIEELAPGLFSANGTGQGVAAAIALTVKPDGTQHWTTVFDGTQPEGSREGIAVNLGSQADQVFLLLFGTGMRNASQATVTIGGVPIGVAGPEPSVEFEGVDQINIGPLPRSLAGVGDVDIILVVDGVAANVVTVRFG